MAAREQDDDAEDVPFRDPPPTDDRLWRHPSELGGPQVPSATAAAPPRRSARVGKLLSSFFSRQRP